MNHDEVEELLGAFALDAVDADQARAIEVHLADCPRCRAEVQAHRETVALIAGSGGDVPPDLWDRVAAAVRSGGSAATGAVSADDGWHEQSRYASRRGASRLLVRVGARRGVALAAIAAAIAAIVVLSVQIAGLDSRIDRLNSALGRSGLSGVVAQVALAPHTTVNLDSTRGTRVATVIVSKQGAAYWVGSSLRTLASSKTYQIWGLAHGRAVSLGLVGANPRRYAAFRVERGTREMMVTIEPEGGASVPTLPVVASGGVATTA
jgi:anti-sigma factor RsiW